MDDDANGDPEGAAGLSVQWIAQLCERELLDFRPTPARSVENFCPVQMQDKPIDHPVWPKRAHLGVVQQKSRQMCRSEV